MKIIKITPQGFCKGVINAIKILNNTLESNNYPTPIYMLGGIVHNKHIINAYINKGINEIQSIDDISSGTIIITAHGISNKTRNKILNKNLSIIDTTCIEVKKIHDIIKSKIDENYDVIYYGNKKHPECVGILEDYENIHLVQTINDIYPLNITNQKIIFISQTTVAYDDVKIIEDLIKKKYPNVITISDICNATKYRQLSLVNSANECDLILIIGDRFSNNTNRLYSLASKYTKAIQIENIEELSNIDFTNINTLGITAGASTPNVLVDEIIKTIKDNTYISTLKDNDYIKMSK